MPFFGRERELEDLRDEFAVPRPSLVIVYGRRRIGKSTLLQEAAKGASASVYFQATIGEPADGLAAFKAEIAKTLGDDGIIGGLSDWMNVLNWLAKVAKTRKGLIVILDEFPYLSDRQDALPSIIQKFSELRRRRERTSEAGPLRLARCVHGGSTDRATSALRASNDVA